MTKASFRLFEDPDVCAGHGVCALIAPDLFSVDDDGVSHHPDVSDEADVGQAQEAGDSCPTQAIELAPVESGLDE